MLEHIKTVANRTFTENGAATHITTFSDCLDLFATIGALRSQSKADICARFLRAYTEDPDLAMKLLFFARDVRGGLGERRVFRICLRWLATHKSASVVKNLGFIAEYGRWDDLLCLLDTPCRAEVIRVLRSQLEADLAALEQGGSVSLLGKWLPSVNASNADTVKQAKCLARAWGMTDAQYRKTLATLRRHIRILENDLRERSYTFDYSKQPSKAMFKYRSAFLRNDFQRYTKFLDSVDKGEAKLHADTLMPYELVESCLEYSWDGSENMRRLSADEERVLNATWASLPRFQNSENALAVIDTSGSMYTGTKPMPAAVALSLGLYFAEHNTGAFRGHFIEFSHTPQLIPLKGETFTDRLRYASSFSEIADTDLEAVFGLILRAAVQNRVPAEELPSTLYIISDMEFNRCVRNANATVFDNARARFAEHGYELPRVVFWNVQSRNTQQPVTMTEQGVALVSGCTPRLFSMVAEGKLSPMDYMLEILESPRYSQIAA